MFILLLGQTLYVGGGNKNSYKIQNSILEQIQTSSISDPIRIVASRSHLNEETKKYISQFPQYELLQSGSSIKLCMVAEGRLMFILVLLLLQNGIPEPLKQLLKVQEV